jgi:hypothetical protein
MAAEVVGVPGPRAEALELGWDLVLVVPEWE